MLCVGHLRVSAVKGCARGAVKVRDGINSVLAEFLGAQAGVRTMGTKLGLQILVAQAELITT